MEKLSWPQPCPVKSMPQPQGKKISEPLSQGLQSGGQHNVPKDGLQLTYCARCSTLHLPGGQNPPGLAHTPLALQSQFPCLEGSPKNTPSISQRLPGQLSVAGVELQVDFSPRTRKARPVWRKPKPGFWSSTTDQAQIFKMKKEHSLSRHLVAVLVRQAWRKEALKGQKTALGDGEISPSAFQPASEARVTEHQRAGQRFPSRQSRPALAAETRLSRSCTHACCNISPHPPRLLCPRLVPTQPCPSTTSAFPETLTTEVPSLTVSADPLSDEGPT